jgi:hypothetical protein
VDDDELGEAGGTPRRHHGRDPWSIAPRPEAMATPRAPAVGDFVALELIRERTDWQGRSEELWVEVTAVDGDAFEGTLDNQPTWIRGLSPGDRVQFGLADVRQVRTPKTR